MLNADEAELYRHICRMVTVIIEEHASSGPDADQCIFGFVAGYMSSRGASKEDLREMLEVALSRHPQNAN